MKLDAAQGDVGVAIGYQAFTFVCLLYDHEIVCHVDIVSYAVPQSVLRALIGYFHGVVHDRMEFQVGGPGLGGGHVGGFVPHFDAQQVGKRISSYVGIDPRTGVRAFEGEIHLGRHPHRGAGYGSVRPGDVKTVAAPVHRTKRCLEEMPRNAVAVCYPVGRPGQRFSGFEVRSRYGSIQVAGPVDAGFPFDRKDAHPLGVRRGVQKPPDREGARFADERVDGRLTGSKKGGGDKDAQGRISQGCKAHNQNSISMPTVGTKGSWSVRCRVNTSRAKRLGRL